MTKLTRGQAMKSQRLHYQCIRCLKWVEENDAAIAKEGVMCLDCYTLLLKRKQEQNDPSSAALARLYQAKPPIVDLKRFGGVK